METFSKNYRKVVIKDMEGSINSTASSPLLELTTTPAAPGPSTSTPIRDNVPNCKKKLRYSSELSATSWSSEEAMPPDQTIIASMLARAICLNKKIRISQEEILALTTRKNILVKELETINQFIEKECGDEVNIIWKNK